MLSDEERAAAQKLIEDATLAALDFALPCEATGHDRGESGCEPTRPAEYLIELTSCQSEHVAAVATFVACRGFAIHVRGLANTSHTCLHCNTAGTMANFVRVKSGLAELPQNPIQ